MARTAVITGTASAVAGASANRQAGRQQAAAQQQAAPQQQDQQAAQMQAQLGGGGGGDLMSELGKLADLKAAGVLTDDEFTAAKAKLLA